MLSTLIAALALAAPVPKAAPVDLKWKFTKGETFYVTHEQEVAFTVNGAARPTVTAAALVYQVTVKAAGDAAELELQVVSLKVAAWGGAAKLVDEPSAVDKKVAITLDKARNVTKVDGKLAKGGMVVSDLLEESYLRHNVEDLFRAVPGEPLGKGDTWTGKREGPLNDGLVDKRSDRGTVAGVGEGVVTLEVESDRTWSGDGGAAITMTGEKGKRAVQFDPKAGRVRKLEEAFSVSGSVVVAGGGGGAQKLTQSITVKTTVTVSDEKPKDEK